MKKKNLKLLTTAIIIVLFFSVYFSFKNKVLAEEQTGITVETTGYSAVSPSYFVLSGYYSGNINKKGFTTYFQFKKNNSDLDIEEGRQETIKIVRKVNVREENDFYTGPELNLFSTYYFRAVGYLNDNPDQKYYGETQVLNTGYLPAGFSNPFAPFTVSYNDTGVGGTGTGNQTVTSYVDPICVDGEILVNNVCVPEEIPIVKSGNKSILLFDFLKDGYLYAGGNIYENNIRLNLKKEDGIYISSLSPTIRTSLLATVSPASGVPQNFTSPVTYTVTAEDGSTKNYTVIVLVGGFMPGSDTTSCPIGYSGTFPNCTTGSGSGGGVGGSGIGGDNSNNYNYLVGDSSINIGSTGSQGESSILVPCGTKRDPATKIISNPCNFNYFLTMINNIINFVLFKMALPIAAILFAYAGFMLITSGGDMQQRSKALKVFKNVGIGLILIAGSWLIISTILSILGFDGSWIGF